VREVAPGDRRLVAYVVPAHGPPDVDELRGLLKTKLPPFMVPSSFVTLETLPVNANGKLDRGALPAPSHARPQMARSYAEPETPVQQTLASIWGQVLAVDRVGVDDDFFDLGGHSLLGVKMLARVQDTLGVEINLARLFDSSTVRELAEAVTAELMSDVGEDELASLLDEPEPEPAPR
jgi:acyl carrier protein